MRAVSATLMLVSALAAMVGLLAAAALAAPADGDIGQGSHASPQALFTVNTADDSDDGACDLAHCSLREAIAAANENAETDAIDSIAFDIPGPGPHTIHLTGPLPTITGPVVIDGYTQPGASPNTNPISMAGNAVLRIGLDASGAGASGLRITAGSSTVRGLVFSGFSEPNQTVAIRLEGQGGNTIQGNYIGTDFSGTVAVGEAHFGVLVDGAPDNLIGGATPEARNLISAHDAYEVFIIGEAATANRVQGNFIGTDVTGTRQLARPRDGVRIDEASYNLVGGATPEARNLISGNGACGVWLTGPNATNNLVQGNYIGTDRTGAVALGNEVNGILIDRASSNVIGGAEAGAGNLISANGHNGVYLLGAAATDNEILGNIIGADITGSVPPGNGRDGVRISGSHHNAIGGTEAGAGNVIAFNRGDGIYAQSGSANAIQSNSIFANTGLGIDLAPDGLTPNDAEDADAGANNLQNSPDLGPVVLSTDGGLVVHYSVDAAPGNAAYPLTIEFFTPDSDGEEGEGLLGRGSYPVDRARNVAVADLGIASGAGVAVGDLVLATATDDGGNTSEFSETAPVLGTCADHTGDGRVDILDVIISIRVTVGLVAPTPAQQVLGDLNQDGTVTALDAMLTLQHLVGLTSALSRCGAWL